MSGAGTRNKGKTLIQSKLSFTSTLQPNAKGKLPEATLSTDEKGIKRKFGKQNRITIPIDACSSFLVNLLVNYYWLAVEKDSLASDLNGDDLSQF